MEECFLLKSKEIIFYALVDRTNSYIWNGYHSIRKIPKHVYLSEIKSCTKPWLATLNGYFWIKATDITGTKKRIYTDNKRKFSKAPATTLS